MSKVIYHRHHVVPKHAGGTDDPSNMTCPLTIEEHAEHHRYRYEMLGEWQDRLAWKSLCGLINTDVNWHGTNNPFFGRRHSEETKQKMRQSHAKRKPISDETRQKMSEAMRGNKNHFFGKTHTIEVRLKLSNMNKMRKSSKSLVKTHPTHPA